MASTFLPPLAPKKDQKIIKTETDDNATLPLAKGLTIEVLDLPFITTGGNVLTDGLGTAFSSCILLNENKFYGVSKENFFRLNKELAGFGRYHNHVYMQASRAQTFYIHALPPPKLMTGIGQSEMKSETKSEKA